jgi:hypothetical protein
MTVAQASDIPRLAGLATVVADHSWPGTSATVLRLLDPGGRQMILKRNTSTGSFQREHAALACWTGDLGASAPQLLDADEAEQDLLMTAVAGRPLALLSLTRVCRSIVHTALPASSWPGSTTPRPRRHCPTSDATGRCTSAPS